MADDARLDELRADITRTIRNRIYSRPVWTSERLADALLPVVREAIADELDGAVDEVENTLDAYIALGCGDTLARVLCELAESFRVRADALRDGTRA